MLPEPPDRSSPLPQKSAGGRPPVAAQNLRTSGPPQSLPKQKSRRLAAPVDPAMVPARNHRRTPPAYHDSSSPGRTDWPWRMAESIANGERGFMVQLTPSPPLHAENALRTPTGQVLPEDAIQLD